MINVKNLINTKGKLSLFIQMDEFKYKFDIKNNPSVITVDDDDMLYIDLRPLLFSKIGIRLSKFHEIEDFNNIKDALDFKPIKGYIAVVENRKISLYIGEDEDIEMIRKNIHKEIKRILRG